MKTKTFNKITYTIVGVLLCIFSFGQIKGTTETSKLLTVKFSNYSVEADKKIQAEFNKNGSFKAVYTCIPAGVIVISSINNVTITEKQEIERRIASIDTNFKFEVLLGLSINQAEEKCATQRTIEN